MLGLTSLSPIFNNSYSSEDLALFRKITNIYKISHVISEYIDKIDHNRECSSFLWERFAAPLWEEKITIIYLGINGVIHDAKKVTDKNLKEAREQVWHNEDRTLSQELLGLKVESLCYTNVEQIHTLLKKIKGQKAIVLTSGSVKNFSVPELRWAYKNHFFSQFIIGKTEKDLNEDKKWLYSSYYAPYYLLYDNQLKDELLESNQFNQERWEEWTRRKTTFWHRTIKIVDYIDTHPKQNFVIFDHNEMGDFQLSPSVFYKNPFGNFFVYVNSQKLLNKTHRRKALKALGMDYNRLNL